MGKEVRYIVKISTDLCCTLFYVRTKDAEKHKARHLLLEFYMKLVVKLFFCGHLNEEQMYKIS